MTVGAVVNKHPSLGIALGRRTRWRGLAPLFMLAVLRVLLGAFRPLARCPRVLLVAWRGHHRGAHDDGGRDQGLLQGATPDRRCRPLPDDQAPGRRCALTIA